MATRKVRVPLTRIAHKAEQSNKRAKREEPSIDRLNDRIEHLIGIQENDYYDFDTQKDYNTTRSDIDNEISARINDANSAIDRRSQNRSLTHKRIHAINKRLGTQYRSIDVNSGSFAKTVGAVAQEQRAKTASKSSVGG